MQFSIYKPNRNIRKVLLRMFEIEGDKHLIIKNKLSLVLIDTQTNVCRIYEDEYADLSLIYIHLNITTEEQLRYVLACVSVDIPFEQIKILLRGVQCNK
jgi:hypothetical protein